MALLRAGSFDDAVRKNPIANILDEVSSAIKTWGQRLGEYKNEIMATVSLLLGYLAVQPLLQEQFSFADVFRARLILVAASLLIVPIFVSPLFSRFELRLFQINREPRRPFFPTRRTVADLMVMAVVGGLVYLLNPLGAYAQAHTKAIMEVFYVTDRRTQAGLNGQLVFSELPNDHEGVAEREISYGVGSVPVIWTWWDVVRNLRSKVPLVRNPGDSTLRSLTADDFFNSIALNPGEFDPHNVLIFIHGFDNSFTDSIQSAAKLGLDLKFDGALIAYCWPSKGEPTPTAYSYDGEQSLWSTRHLEAFLAELAKPHALGRIQVIAHSMGNRVLGRAVSDLNPKGPLFANVIMAAADMNDANFNQDASALASSATRVTLYVSTWDQALRISRVANASPRVGEEVVCRHNVDVIDTQGLGAHPWTFLHGYVFESDLVLDDLSALIQHDDPPVRRPHVIQNDDQCTWRLQPR